jgi:hypothetical protein
MLAELRVPQGALVVDPMNGSGTTTVAAQKGGYLSIGVELNPAVAAVARAKDATLATRRDWESVLDSLHRSFLDRGDEDLGPEVNWIPRSIFRQLRKLWLVIANFSFAGDAPVNPRIQGALSHSVRQPSSTADLLLAAVLRIVRRYSRATISKNPTWLKYPNDTLDVDTEVFPEFYAMVLSMARELRDEFGETSKVGRTLILEGDARSMPVRSNVADVIISSPPYLTRIDYAVGTAPELAFLGYATPKQFREMRASIMGSTCVTGGDYRTRSQWGETCLAILDAIRAHTSKASSGYYYKTHIQYFRDAEQFLSDAIRVMKTGTNAVLVIQDSWYKDLHIPLARIYGEMAVMLGALSADTLYSVPVRSHMGLVNTKARRYEKGELHEHVVIIRKA